MQPTGNNLLSNLPPMMVSPRVTAPQASPQGRIFGLGPLTGQLPMVQSLLGRPVTSIMPMTPSHPNVSSVPRVPASLPSVISARLPFAQTLPSVPLAPSSITVAGAPSPTEPPPRVPSQLLLGPLTREGDRTPAFSVVRGKLEKLPDGGPTPGVDRELATLICSPDTYIGSAPKVVSLVFAQACRKNCPMTALALLSKADVLEKEVVATLTSPDIASLGFVLHENVSLPDTPANGYENALHVACRYGYADLMKVLITSFGFRHDLPRYDGKSPIDIIREHTPSKGMRRPRMNRMVGFLQQCPSRGQGGKTRSVPPSTSIKPVEESETATHPIVTTPRTASKDAALLTQPLPVSLSPKKRTAGIAMNYVGVAGIEDGTIPKKQKTNYAAALTLDVGPGVHTTETLQPQDNELTAPSSHTVAPVTLPLNNDDIPELFEDYFLVGDRHDVHPLSNDGMPDDPLSDLSL